MQWMKFSEQQPEQNLLIWAIRKPIPPQKEPVWWMGHYGNPNDPLGEIRLWLAVPEIPDDDELFPAKEDKWWLLENRSP
jgi:hypothetical protein